MTHQKSLQSCYTAYNFGGLEKIHGQFSKVALSKKQSITNVENVLRFASNYKAGLGIADQYATNFWPPLFELKVLVIIDQSGNK